MFAQLLATVVSGPVLSAGLVRAWNTAKVTCLSHTVDAPIRVAERTGMPECERGVIAETSAMHLISACDGIGRGIYCPNEVHVPVERIADGLGACGR